jgi:hypothetical protein
MKSYVTVTLNFVKNDKDNIKEIALKAPSFALKSYYENQLELLPEMKSKREPEKIFNDYVIINNIDISKLTDEDDLNLIMQKAITGEPGFIAKTLEANENAKELAKERELIYLDLFKYSIDTRQLETSLKEMFNSDFDSEFWQAQDYEEVESAVNLFRRKYKLG